MFTNVRARVPVPGLAAGLLLLCAGPDPAGLSAQVLPERLPSGALGHLIWPRTGSHLAHYSSYDRTGGNADFAVIAPGETLTLVDHDGPGVLRRFWLTIAPRNDVEIQRGLIVRCYWDGEEAPSVEVPVSDFFGMGFGLWKDYVSLPLNMTSGGYNSYWPMPFRKSARIVVENTSDVPVERFYYNVDIETRERMPDEVLYFHAQFRRTVTQRGAPVTILETTGRGHYVGTLLAMQPLRGRGFGYLEGDERITVDGEETPSIIGTGTEDYFSSGWYYDTGEYSAPYHGVTLKDADTGRINTYRWHIEDPIPFDQSFRFVIEHGGTNDMPGVVYSSVAYWYQTHPHAPFPPLPANLLPLSGATAPGIEGEDLAATAQATGGEVRTQDMSGFEGEWGGGEQLWWVEAAPGDTLTLSIEPEEAGAYELIAFFTRGRDYGIVRLHAGGRALRPLVDGYGAAVERSGPVSFGTVKLEDGANEIVVELIGKDARSAGYSDGYLVGIDGFLLRETRQ
ncbi:MAG TPA: glycoside hydrolase family 172 protein [Woeseiaceae bacterium]|nr:glycoside hydrolase family 172 protein [Woeseiaceae bacterium]